MLDTTCPRCGVEMRVGIAIESNREQFTRYEMYPPPITAQTLMFIECFKCPHCGHSDDGK